MIEQRNLDDDGIEWMKCYLKKMDDVMNLVIKKKITSDDYILFQWISSYGWKKLRSERNRCLKSPSVMAKLFETSKVTIAKRLKRLREVGLIRTIYRVMTPDGETHEFKTEKASWKYRNKHGGQIIFSIQEILNDAFIVEIGKDGQKFTKRKWEEE